MLARAMRLHCQVYQGYRQCGGWRILLRRPTGQALRYACAYLQCFLFPPSIVSCIFLICSLDRDSCYAQQQAMDEALQRRQ